jgi:hypothetical protein
MSTVIWSGTAAAAIPGSAVISFTIDPVNGAIESASTSGPVSFTPDAGFAAVTGSFSSTLAFPPDALPADPAAAWAAAIGHLLILDPVRTYTMIITQD